jgi:hypothetical protein
VRSGPHRCAAEVSAPSVSWKRRARACSSMHDAKALAARVRFLSRSTLEQPQTFCVGWTPRVLLADQGDTEPVLRRDQVGLVVGPLVELDPVDRSSEPTGVRRVVVAYGGAVVHADVERFVP